MQIEYWIDLILDFELDFGDKCKLDMNQDILNQICIELKCNVMHYYDLGDY